jgi:hypothetical protein
MALLRDDPDFAVAEQVLDVELTEEGGIRVLCGRGATVWTATMGRTRRPSSSRSW